MRKCCESTAGSRITPDSQGISHCLMRTFGNANTKLMTPPDHSVNCQFGHASGADQKKGSCTALVWMRCKFSHIFCMAEIACYLQCGANHMRGRTVHLCEPSLPAEGLKWQSGSCEDLWNLPKLQLKDALKVLTKLLEAGWKFCKCFVEDFFIHAAQESPCTRTYDRFSKHWQTEEHFKSFHFIKFIPAPAITNCNSVHLPSYWIQFKIMQVQ